MGRIWVRQYTGGRRYTYIYAEIDFSTSGLQYGGVDYAGSWYYYIYQPSASTTDQARTISSGSSYPLQVGASYRGFEGLMMEFGIMNSSSSTDENRLRSYLGSKWGTGGCPPANSVENGHGVIATTSTDYYCRVPYENRDCSQSCASGKGKPVGGVATKTCQDSQWTSHDLICEKTCEMTEGPAFTAGCYRTVVSADFNSGDVLNGPMRTYRLFPRTSASLTAAYMARSTDGRLKMDPRACTYTTVYYAEDNPAWLDTGDTQQTVTVEATMQLEYGYGGLAFKMTDERTNLRVQYTYYGSTWWYLYLIMQVGGRSTYLGSIYYYTRDKPPIYVPQRIADARFNGFRNITFEQFFDDAKEQSRLAGHGNRHAEFIIRARVKAQNIKVWLLPLDATHGMAKEDATSDTHEVRNDIDRYYGYDGQFSPLWGPQNGLKNKDGDDTPDNIFTANQEETLDDTKPLWEFNRNDIQAGTAGMYVYGTAYFDNYRVSTSCGAGRSCQNVRGYKGNGCTWGCAEGFLPKNVSEQSAMCNHQGNGEVAWSSQGVECKLIPPTFDSNHPPLEVREDANADTPIGLPIADSVSTNASDAITLIYNLTDGY